MPEGRGAVSAEFGQVKLKLADWPRHGSIKFKNVCLRYRDNWPLVLANVSFRVNHGENIGEFDDGSPVNRCIPMVWHDLT